MIKGSELRIGTRVWESSSFNPLPEDFEEIVVASINDIDKVVHDEQDNIYTYDYLYPIPLTPEWLGRCGFIKKKYRYHGDPESEAVEAFVKDSYVIRLIDTGERKGYRAEYMPYPQSQNSLPGWIDYLHQLQNKYYWWTDGIDLEIKND